MTALGRALLDFWGGNPRKKSYKAKGWLAQIKALVEHRQGSWAADQVGLDVKQDTLIAWLEWAGPEDRAPNPANQRKIHDAYELLAGGQWDSSKENREHAITGWVKTGEDVRYRGITTGPDRSATFKVDTSRAKWTRIREGYESGEIDEDKAEEWFVEDVIEEDRALGEGSPESGWEFPGSSYSVT